MALPCSQKAAIISYHASENSSPHQSHNVTLRSNIILSFQFLLPLQSRGISSDFSTKISKYISSLAFTLHGREDKFRTVWRVLSSVICQSTFRKEIKFRSIFFNPEAGSDMFLFENPKSHICTICLVKLTDFWMCCPLPWQTQMCV